MSYSKRDLEKMGEQAATAFWGKKIPLNDSVSKLAVEGELTKLQMQRVCEFANHATFEQERQRRVQQGKEASPFSGSSPSLYIEFPMAEFKEVWKNASASNFQPKTAATITRLPVEYSQEAPREFRLRTMAPLPQVDTEKLAAAAEYSIDAWDEKQPEPSLGDKLASLLSVRKEIEELQSEAKIARFSHEDRVTELLREILVEKLASLDDVLWSINVKVAHNATEDARKDIISSLGRILEKLAREGAFRIGKIGSPVNLEEFVAKSFDMGDLGPMRVINGENPLFGEIKLLADSLKNERHHGASLHVYNDKVRYAKRMLTGEVPVTDVSNTTRADGEKKASLGGLAESALVGGAGMMVGAGKALAGGAYDASNKIYKKVREANLFQQDMQHQLLGDRTPEEIKPYHKLLSKWMPQFLDMHPDLRAKMLLQLYHTGGGPDEQGGLDLQTLTSLQQMGGTNPRYRDKEVRKEKGMFERMVGL